MDVKNTFLDEDLKEEVCMQQPKGFIIDSNKGKVCILIKHLFEIGSKFLVYQNWWTPTTTWFFFNLIVS